MQSLFNKILRFKFDVLLGLIFTLILINLVYYRFSSVLIFPIVVLAYLRLIRNNDLTMVIILMLSSRLLMGFLVPGNSLVFNIMNLFVNYIPLLIYLLINWRKVRVIKLKRVFQFKYSILYLFFVYILCLPNISYALTEFPKEILPITLFLLIVVVYDSFRIDLNFLLKFFRYTFLAIIITYLIPIYGVKTEYLFENPIVFKTGIDNFAMYINGQIPRLSGFVFDFRIQGQLAVLYFLLIFYTDRKNSYFDLLLLSIVAILTFSRGPIIILLLLLLAVYGKWSFSLFKRYYKFILVSLVLIVSTIFVFVPANSNVNKFVSTFNPLNKKNAISQRAHFSDYSLNKFWENPLGNGIGSLSSPKAENVIDLGYADKEKKHRLFYYKVGDAYWALTLGEKGVIGFALFVFSILEIFYSRRNYVSLFFLVGFGINLIGTDIPKEGFFYFAFLLIYFYLADTSKKVIPENGS